MRPSLYQPDFLYVFFRMDLLPTVKRFVDYWVQIRMDLLPLSNIFSFASMIFYFGDRKILSSTCSVFLFRRSKNVDLWFRSAVHYLQ